MAEPVDSEAGVPMASDVAEQPIPPVQRPLPLPSDLPVLLARRAPGSGTTTNTLTVGPQPIVSPGVKGWNQAEPPWGDRILRPEGHRGNRAGDLWKQAGCHPTCLAIVLRWWAEINPETAGKVVFPFVGSDAHPGRLEPTTRPRRVDKEPEGLTPLEACRKLFGIEFALMRGTDNDTVNQRLAMTGVTLNAPLPETAGLASAVANGLAAIGILGQAVSVLRFPPMQFFEHDNGPLSDPAKKKRALKFLLQWGPLIVGLANPSHFVVVTGYRGETLTLIDPGHDIVRKRWPGIANKGQNLTVRTDGPLKERNGSGDALPNRPFIDNIHQVYLFTFDPTRPRVDWST